MTTSSPTRAETATDLSLDDFPQNGCAQLGSLFDPAEGANLRQWIDRQRPINGSTFYSSPEEFGRHGRWERYAPGTSDHNLLLSPDIDLKFIEESPAFQQVCRRLCGKNYEIQKKSVIRSAPRQLVPGWVVEAIQEVGRPNLNPFVRDEYQDVQYFLATDFHQDKTRPASDFVTVYLYLDDVTAADSALRLLRESHILGMTHYPHSLRRSHLDRSFWYYSDMLGNHVKCRDVTVTGGAGHGACFHCLTLHGTGYNDSNNPRISLRYLIKRGDDTTDCLLELANRNIKGPQSLPHARFDVDGQGHFMKTGSSLLGGG